jgi:hypothetical protein
MICQESQKNINDQRYSKVTRVYGNDPPIGLSIGTIIYQEATRLEPRIKIEEI